MHAFAVPRVLQREHGARITASPWGVAAIVAAFYALLTVPGLAQNPYQFINIGRQYHAKGLPDLRLVQYVLEGLLVIGALALAWWPRHRSPLRFTSYTRL